MANQPLTSAATRRRAIEEVGFWWHSIDFGDGVVSPGFKSPELLRRELDALELPDLTGRRVLDIGGWDGFFAFAAEARGAVEVSVLDHYVWSLDLPRQQAYWRECQAAGISPVPYEKTDLWQPDALPGKHGFDTARRLLASDVGEIVADFGHDDLSEVGQWDVVMFLGVLYHLENPLDALRRLRALTTEMAIIETHAIVVPGHEETPLWRIWPGAELNADSSNWWSPNLAGLRAGLEAAGFAEVTVARGIPDDGGLDYRAVVHAHVTPLRNGERYARSVSQPASESPAPVKRSGEPLLTRLIAEAVVVCPRCSSGDLSEGEDAVRCPACGASFARRHGIVDFLEYATAPSGRRVEAPPEVVEGVIRALGLSDTEQTRSTVADIYSRTFLRVPSPSLNAEISSFAERFGLEASAGTRPFAAERAGKALRRLRQGRDVRARFERHYVESPLPPDALIHRNVRLANVGRSAWASHGPRPVHLEARWGQAPGERTRFPITIDPGRAISVPVRLRTPSTAGGHTLQVGLVRGESTWLADSVLEIPVRVQDGARFRAEAGLRLSGEEYDYARDHEVAIELLRRQLPAATGGRPLRVLEIGGGTSPQIGPLSEIDAINIDIVAPLLELGAVLYGPGSRDRLQFLCCDALQPPFRAGSFDAVVMFATLHHFPEPEALLTTCRELLAPGGFVAILCEPVGDSLEHPVTVRDLLSGINEQVFSLPEYLAIFDRAELAIDSGQLDGGSLKAVLRPSAV